MDVNPYPILFAILLILLGVYLWRIGNKKESFWEALFELIGDILIFDFPVFSTFRAWALFLWLIGFGVLILDIIGVIHLFLFK
jgi:hypothetical protein